VHQIRNVFATKKQAKEITTIHEFQRKTPGYLQLTISPWQHPDHEHFEAITEESQRRSLMKGCNVTPLACSLFRDYGPLVTGLLMDTT
jgi:hypothetical protein